MQMLVTGLFTNFFSIEEVMVKKTTIIFHQMKHRPHASVACYLPLAELRTVDAARLLKHADSFLLVDIVANRVL